MEPPVHNGTVDPEKDASWWSKLTFSWTLPLLRRGQRHRLERDDLYTLPEHIHTANATERLERSWRHEIKKQEEKKVTPGFRMALARAFVWDFARTAPLVLTEDLVCLSQPIIFRYLMGYFAQPRTITTAEAWLLAFCLATANIILAFISPHIIFRLIKNGMMWQSATCGLIYRKMMQLSYKARTSVKSGHIIDLVSKDAEKLDWLIWYLHTPWQASLRIVIVTAVVYQTLGNAVFAAMALFCILIPLQAFLARRVAYHRKFQLEAMDNRISIINELVSAMRLVKMYCWEIPFTDKVSKVRGHEMKSIWHSRIWGTLMMELLLCNKRLTIVIMVLVYVAQDGVMAAATIFPAYDLFSQLSYMLSEEIPLGIKAWLDVGVSTARIEKFLLLEDAEETRDMSESKDFDGKVEMSDVTANWSLDTPRLTLDSVYLNVERGQLLMVHGEVGSGKTSLLKVLMGELPIISGHIKCSHCIAYVPQTPWVFSATLKQNVLFGLHFDSEKYYNVLKATALDQDVVDLPYGDGTLVGEKGVSLSGGQKARVCLARALYADADVYLLDDPLSAVDTTVGNLIMQRGIKGLLKNKTVILVTHQLQYLREADLIVSLKEGKIEKSGTFHDVIPQDVELGEYETPKENPALTDSIDDDRKCRQKEIYLKEIEEQKEEMREYGVVGWSVYLQYFRAGGKVWLQLTVAALFILTQSINSLSDWWLSVWSNSEENELVGLALNSSQLKSQSSPTLSTQQFTYVYIALIMLMLIVGLCRTLSYNYVTVLASTNLHRQIFNRMIRAPITFFDTTPKGRIVNRFAGDMGTIDDAIPEILFFLIALLLQIAANMILTVILNWHLIFTVLPCMILLYLIRRTYLNAQRHLTRLKRTANSPFLGHLSSSVDGVEVIRAFHADERCYHDYGQHQDTAIGAWYSVLAAFLWFHFSCNATGSLLNICVFVTCLLGSEHISPSTIGLIFCLTIPMTSWFQNAMRYTAEIELEMTSTERVLEYTRLDQEKALESVPNNKPEESWPESGAVSFRDVVFSYRENTPVLNDVSFDIAACDIVGVVGRTGAGKSSLVQALFRMAEPEGTITIDGIDTAALGLHDVRGNISVIPQDPVLFNGTVRSNLDPFSKHLDDSIWEALEQVKLKRVALELTGQLDCPITHGGSNFSAGERQLFCLARALLTHRKLLVLDEATANVDKQTDEVIQETIRSQFADHTVITIAHRLNTVMDSDKIMVLDRGVMLEYDEPYVLLTRRGKLYDMVQQTGDQEANRLYEVARESFRSRHKAKQDS